MRAWAGIDMPVHALSRWDILELRDGMSAGKARNFVIVTSRLLNYAIDRGYITSNPAVRVAKPKVGEAKRWPDEILERFEKEARPEAKAIFRLALYTGQRISDLVRITDDDIQNGYGRFRQRKTGADVWFPLRRDFERIRLNSRQASDLFRHELKVLGIKGYTLHGLRKTFAARLAEASATSEEIAAALGHSDIRMASHYTKQADKERLARSAHARKGN